MDSKRWEQFKQLVDGVIAKVGESEVTCVSFYIGDGDIHLTTQAFELLCGQRVVEQKFHRDSNHRHFMVGDYFRLFAVYPIPQPRPTTARGEYIDLCCEISEEEIKTVLREQTVIAAEAVSDG